MKSLILTLIFAVSLSATAQVKVYKPGGKVLEGSEVKYKTGKIVLAMSTGGNTLHDVTQVLRIESPMDGRKAGMWKRLLAGDFELVGGDAGKTLEETNRFLGWGKRIAFAYCYSLIKNGNLKEAMTILGRAGGYMRGTNDKLDSQLITIALAYADFANGSSSRALKKLDSVANNLEQEARPFFYNLQGDILTKMDKTSQAVLAYYKTVLLDKTSGYERGYAKAKITDIYTKQGDTARAAKVKKL